MEQGRLPNLATAGERRRAGQAAVDQPAPVSGDLDHRRDRGRAQPPRDPRLPRRGWRRRQPPTGDLRAAPVRPRCGRCCRDRESIPGSSAGGPRGPRTRCVATSSRTVSPTNCSDTAPTPRTRAARPGPRICTPRSDRRIVQPESVGWEEVQPYLAGERTRPEQFDADERQLLDEFRTLLASGAPIWGSASYCDRVSIRVSRWSTSRGRTPRDICSCPTGFRRLTASTAAHRQFFGEIVDRYYETADGFLGRLLADREGWTVMIVSDHGFATDATRPRTTDSRIGHGAAADWHRRFGILVLSGEVHPPGRTDR